MYYISSFLLIPNGSRDFPVSMRYASLAFRTLTYSIKRAREIRKFHVAVVQQRLRNVQKRVMHLQLFFCQSKPIVFCCSPSPLPKLPIVVIQKFCYHGNSSPNTLPFLRKSPREETLLWLSREDPWCPVTIK